MLNEQILDAWKIVTEYIATGHANEFSGRSKEGLVFDRLQKQLTEIAPLAAAEPQTRFGNWIMDLDCQDNDTRIAVEGKFKTQRDGAAPDNRKAAFFDIYKLERYVNGGMYSQGLFLWLTDNRSYLMPASGDSRDFSTHEGRIYEPDTALNASRTRNVGIPLPLALSGRYTFKWSRVATSDWWQLIIIVDAPPT